MHSLVGNAVGIVLDKVGGDEKMSQTKLRIDFIWFCRNKIVNEHFVIESLSFKWCVIEHSFVFFMNNIL